jgi:CheY-like chemotaxis protein
MYGARLLKGSGRVSKVVECTSGAQALDELRRLRKVDVCFIDIVSTCPHVFCCLFVCL